MNGIDKITQRIAGDARQEAEEILAQARAQAGEISARYQAQAEQIAQDAKVRGEAAAAERESRLVSAAQREGRQQLLSAKQEMLDKAFDLALERLCSLPESDYVDLLAKLTVSAVSTGREQLILSQTDRARYGVKVATKANLLLAKSGRVGLLTLSQESRGFRGGAILADGDVEINCTFEALVREARSSVSGEVAGVLFA